MKIKSKITPQIRGWYDECILAINEPLRNDLDRIKEMSNVYMNEFFGWKIDYFYVWLNNYFVKIVNALFTLEKVVLIPFLKGRVSEFNFEFKYYDNIIKSLDRILLYKEQLKMNLGKNIVILRKMIDELIKDINFYLDYKETIIPDILKDNFKFINKNIFLSIVKYNSKEINRILLPWILNSYNKWYNDEKRAIFVRMLPSKTKKCITKWDKDFNKSNERIYNMLSFNEIEIKKCCSCI